jgi:hypothetical protein
VLLTTLQHLSGAGKGNYRFDVDGPKNNMPVSQWRATTSGPLEKRTPSPMTSLAARCELVLV